MFNWITRSTSPSRKYQKRVISFLVVEGRNSRLKLEVKFLPRALRSFNSKYFLLRMRSNEQQLSAASFRSIKLGKRYPNTSFRWFFNSRIKKSKERVFSFCRKKRHKIMSYHAFNYSLFARSSLNSKHNICVRICINCNIFIVELDMCKLLKK